PTGEIAPKSSSLPAVRPISFRGCGLVPHLPLPRQGVASGGKDSGEAAMARWSRGWALILVGLMVQASLRAQAPPVNRFDAPRGGACDPPRMAAGGEPVPVDGGPFPNAPGAFRSLTPTVTPDPHQGEPSSPVVLRADEPNAFHEGVGRGWSGPLTF